MGPRGIILALTPRRIHTIYQNNGHLFFMIRNGLGEKNTAKPLFLDRKGSIFLAFKSLVKG